MRRKQPLLKLKTLSRSRTFSQSLPELKNVTLNKFNRLATPVSTTFSLENFYKKSFFSKFERKKKILLSEKGGKNFIVIATALLKQV